MMGACESVCLCFIVVRIVDSFFKNPLLNYLEKATPTHPSPKDTIGISCFGVIEQMKLNAWLNVLPVAKKSVSCNSLHLLKIGLWMKINSELLNILERRIVSM